MTPKYLTSPHVLMTTRYGVGTCTDATLHVPMSARSANSVVFITWYNCAWVEGNLLRFIVEVVNVLVQHHLAHFTHGELVQWPCLRGQGNVAEINRQIRCFGLAWMAHRKPVLSQYNNIQQETIHFLPRQPLLAVL